MRPGRRPRPLRVPAGVAPPGDPRAPGSPSLCPSPPGEPPAGRARGRTAMDHKPLLQDRPPPYNLESGQGEYACGPHGYGAIPTAPPPPPYPYLVTGGSGRGARRERGVEGRCRGQGLVPSELCILETHSGSGVAASSGPSDALSPSVRLQGYPRSTPGSTTSTAGASPATPPIPSWSSEAARCAGECAPPWDAPRPRGPLGAGAWSGFPSPGGGRGGASWAALPVEDQVCLVCASWLLRLV